MITERCIECGAQATWVRHTQFAGNHPFCEQHARAESDFGESDSYGYWAAVEDIHSDKGYELGSLEDCEAFAKARDES